MRPAILLLALVSTLFISACGGSGSPASTSATAPSAPAGVTAAVGNTRIQLSWAAVSGATSYNVYYRTTAGVTTANGTKITGATSGGVITGLTNGTTYYFVVTAVNAGGESAISSEVNATPQVPTPGAPTGVGATAGNGQVTIIWTAVSGAVSYNVYYRTAPGVTVVNGTKVTGATSGSAITSLTNGMTYYFVVTAVSAGGESAVSSEVNATPVSPGVWTTKAPMVYQRDNAANAVLNGIIYVMGGAPAGVSVLSSMEVYDPATNLWLANNPTTGTPWASMPAPRYGPAAAPVNGVIYLIGGTSLVNGQGPIYPIVVYDPTTNAWSSTVPTTAATTIALTAGQTLAPLPTGRWGFDVAVVDGLIYAVGGAVRVPGGITKSSKDWTTNITNATSGTPITGLADGKTYYFIITAVDATSGIESAESFGVSATPQASYAAGAVPAGLSTAAGDGQATISWTAVTGATSYNVYYSIKSGVTVANGTKITGATSGIPLTPFTPFANGTAYYFIVTAMVSGVETAASDEVSVTPQAAPAASVPSGVSITGGSGQVTLSWAPVGTAASYNIYYGTDKNIYYGTVEAYDPVANTWTTKASMPTPRWGSTVSVVNGLIYAIGGWGGWPELSVVEVYNPATNSWSTTVPVTAATTAAGTAGAPLAPMITARDDFGFAVVNGIIYAIGGDINGFDDYKRTPCCTTVVEAYDPVKNNWTTKTPMPTIRDDFDASTVDGVIYAIAGSRDGQFTASPTPPPGLPPAPALTQAWLDANDGGYSLTTVEAFSTSNVPVPRGVTATASGIQASISWNAVAGATSYNIYWSKKAGVSTTANSTKIPNATSPYTHPALTADTWYYYVVTAVTASGESLPSGEVAVKP